MADSTRSETVRFHGATFAPPAALLDTSVLSFVDRQAGPSVSLTVAQEPLGGGRPAFKVYVDDQQKAAQKAVPGYAATGVVDRTVAGAPALLVEGTAPSASRGRKVIQLYVLDEKRARVFIVTATASDADAARARDAVAQIEQTFSLEGAA